MKQTTKTLSARSKVISKPEIVKARRVTAVDPNEIARKYEEQKKKKLANMYKFHDPCAHIRSVGNGL